jgi:NAD+ diphosphatase
MIGFTGSRIERADHLRLQPERIAELVASPDARLLELAGLDPVLDGEGRLSWCEDGATGSEPQLLFLGFEGDAPLFAPLRRIDNAGPAWAVFGQLAQMSAADIALWGAARSLIAWHGRHGFCANCGTATELFRAGWGRRCAQCAAEHYPRVDPVVIMLAEHRGRVLLGRQPQYPARRYSALAGFVEPGESIEEAVARELGEEAGIVAGKVRYVASQPWPFPSSLMIACIAEAEADALRIDHTELEDARWFTRDEVERALADDAEASFLPPPPIAIARTLMAEWLAPRGAHP